MKSLRMLSPAGFLVLVILGACFSAGMASGQDSKGQLSGWDNLKSLTSGQEILVVMNNVKSHQGKLQSLSDSGITLRQAKGELTLARKDILRVSQKIGQNHQTRNALIGMVVGATAGLVIGLSPYYGQRNCTLGPDFACGNPPNPHLAEALTPVGALAGGAVGGLLPTGGWHEVYRAR
ncbi:MAG TPA: hypothetical protein VFQ24_07405 [Terriglobia bacterium]|nr:hypothetical protein [Terriglobia bacterium]